MTQIDFGPNSDTEADKQQKDEKNEKDIDGKGRRSRLTRYLQPKPAKSALTIRNMD